MIIEIRIKITTDAIIITMMRRARRMKHKGGLREKNQLKTKEDTLRSKGKIN